MGLLVVPFADVNSRNFKLAAPSLLDGSECYRSDIIHKEEIFCPRDDFTCYDKGSPLQNFYLSRIS